MFPGLVNCVSFIRLLGGGVPYGDEVTAILWENTRHTVAPSVPSDILSVCSRALVVRVMDLRSRVRRFEACLNVRVGLASVRMLKMGPMS